MSGPRGQVRPPRYSYRFHAFIGKLCEEAGFDAELFYKPDPYPWPDHRTRVIEVVKELRAMIVLRERLHYSELGYRVDTDAQLAHAKNLEKLALRGKWLIEEEEDALEAKLLGAALTPAMEGIVARSEARRRIEALTRELLEGTP